MPIHLDDLLNTLETLHKQKAQGVKEVTVPIDDYLWMLNQILAGQRMAKQGIRVVDEFQKFRKKHEGCHLKEEE